MKNITVVGMGYVGMSIAAILSQNNRVLCFDIDKNKLEKIDKKTSPIIDNDLQEFLDNENLDLHIATDEFKAFKESKYVVVATPTNYDEYTNFFDTSSVESICKKIIEINNKCLIIIKSTVPVGFVARVRKELNTKNIIFSPEFLREGTALYDNLHPSRIIVGSKSEKAKLFANLLIEGAKKQKDQIDILFTGSEEAEAIKLFSNTFLAMRISFFNELDSYCLIKNLNTYEIIDGVSKDPRIGNHYNNPSFGYGGYCLPKDTKQLLANYESIPNEIINAIVNANRTRKDVISDDIISKNLSIIGIYRLVMKQGSDNFRSSAIQGIMKRLKSKGLEILIYEPLLEADTYFNSTVVSSLDEFKDKSEIILANRMHNDLKDIEEKVYTRDLYQIN